MRKLKTELTTRAKLEADRAKLEGSLETMEGLSEDVSVAGSLLGRMSRYLLHILVSFLVSHTSKVPVLT